MRLFVLKSIKIYQKTLSFDHGIMRVFFPNGYCKYHPTCSDYAYLAVEKYGILKGGLKSIWRILRCNPFSKGGHDPVK
ncbi:MAG: membrane protein insertion efficiency factor YidD [Candidatus Buchananbacteria bacterium]|nr:membrane protein insertion efficiency factor YidD [Candidatus Buchananbacteria bacterium]